MDKTQRSFAPKRTARVALAAAPPRRLARRRRRPTAGVTSESIAADITTVPSTLAVPGSPDLPQECR